MDIKKPLIMEQKVIASIIKNYLDDLAVKFPNPGDYIKQLDNFKKNVSDDQFMKQIDPENELKLTPDERTSLKMYIDDAIKKYNEGQLDGTTKISDDIKARIDTTENLFYRVKGSFNPEKQSVLIRKIVYVAKDSDSVLRVINGVEGLKKGIDDTIETANLIDDATIKAISEDEILYNGLLDANATQMWNNLQLGKTKDGLDIDFRTYFDEITFKDTFKQKLKEKYDVKINNYKNKGNEIDEPQNTVTKDFKPPKLEDVKFKPALIEVYNTKTKMYDMYRVNLPDRLVPGRTKEDVAFKMKNLRKDLGIDYLTHNWRKRMGGNPISLTKDSGIVYDGKTGRLYDSNTRYWLNIEYGNIPKADELNYSYSNTIAKDNGKLIGSNKQSQLNARVEYLNLPKTSSWNEGFDEIDIGNYKNFITSE